MAETRKYTKAGRRAIISSSDLLIQDGEYAIICVPIPALEIARKMVRNRGYWRTSYASAYNDSDYDLPSDETFDIITGYLDEFLEGTTSMDCSDFIKELDDIENAITALSLGGGCGCGSGGGGATSPAVEDTDTGDITLATGTPPPGYPSWEVYQVAKCDIATWAVQNLLDDVRWWQTIQIATLTIAGLTAGMASVLSAFTLTAIIAGLLSILAYEVSMLNDAEVQLVTGFEDLVCAILAGETAQESMDNFISEMDTQMTAAITDPISEFLIIQLLTVWTDTEMFNLLYADYDEFLGRQVPAGSDCSGCGLGCVNFVVNQGSWSGGLTFASEFASGFHFIDVIWNTDSDPCDFTCGPMEEHALMSMVGYTPAAGAHDSFRIWGDDDCPNTSTNAGVYSSDTQPVFGDKYCGRRIAVFSDTAFTLTLERYGACA